MCLSQRPKYMLRRFMVNPANCGASADVRSRLILAASSGLTSSSASSERIQSPLALASAEFFCGANPFHGSEKTFGPRARGRDTGASVLSESTKMISSARPRRLSRVRVMLASSLRVMMQTERVMRAEYQACSQPESLPKDERVKQGLFSTKAAAGCCGGGGLLFLAWSHP